MLLNRDKSQLLIVDVQDKLLEAMSAKTRLVERGVRLVQAAKALVIPITVSEQYPKGLGHTVEAVRWSLPNSASVMEKIEFSCAKNEAIREHLHELRRQGRSQVVIAGIESHVCVAQTALDLEGQGFDTFVVADAVSSRSKTSKKLALARLLRAGVDIVDSEMVIFEWLGQAGTPEFKELQALVK
jgi:nicotinamidase-related amidase